MSNLTLKQKDYIVSLVYKKYQRAQLDIIYLNQHYNYYPQSDICKIKESTTSYHNGDYNMIKMLDRKRELEEYVEIVDRIHTHLSKESKFFIDNEYLNFYDRSWWYKYYSRASYYRIKHKALDEFLESSQVFFDSYEFDKVIK